jgi:hypothetical protein
MSRERPSPAAPNAVSFKLGRWAEAQASGWGVVALVILATLLAAILIRS